MGIKTLDYEYSKYFVQGALELVVIIQYCFSDFREKYLGSILLKNRKEKKITRIQKVLLQFQPNVKVQDCLNAEENLHPILKLDLL